MLTPRSPHPSTFSIVALNPASGELGIAVQSKFLAVGSAVPWAKAGIGAIATQSYANTAYGPDGLALLAQGFSAQETIEKLTAADPDRDLRQVGIVSARGDAATFTGAKCHDWAGGRTGEHYAAQGNILVGAATVNAMANAFEQTSGTLAERLLAALSAGQAAGGDKRGQQSAALLVVKEKGGYGGFNDVLIDLRVDDHPTPIEELHRLYGLHLLFFDKSTERELIAITADVARELQTALAKLGLYRDTVSGEYDDATRAALWDFCGIENLEERWCDGAEIDPEVLKFVRGVRGVRV